MRQIEQNVSPMSNEGRNGYVIQQMTNALLELLAEKPLNDISISELCARAGVGRASFYRNFECKEDILRRRADELFQEWTAEWGEDGASALSKRVRVMFGHFERYRDFYGLLSKRGLIYLLKDVFAGVFGPQPECGKEAAYASAFVTYTLYGWTEVWFQRGMRESAEELAGMFQGRGL